MDLQKMLKEGLKHNLDDFEVQTFLFDVCRLLEADDFNKAHEVMRLVRKKSLQKAKKEISADALTLYKKTLLFDAPYDFDTYCQYIEFNRPYDKQFYLPRRKQLKVIANALQDLADGVLEVLAISLPPGVGKTTLALFFLTWLAGKNPEKPILTGSHSNSFLRGAYEECLRIVAQDGEYLWNDVFDAKVVKTNAQDMMADFGAPGSKGKRFATLEFSSIGSGNAGKVRAENLLYCDDLVSDLMQALSRERMDTLWNQYTTDLRQRKIGDCRELHIATRWSVNDVIGRLSAAYDGSPKARFISIPALNENDESNFDYGNHAGFSTSFYIQQREIMDDASWRALYMNEPIEREGQLYPEQELRRYYELPDREPDAILSICDTKDKGTDYCFMPIAYQYGSDFYVEDCICDNGMPEVVESRLVNILLKHKVDASRFESNSAGGKIAEKVQKEVKLKGGKTRITTKFTTANKETKIIVASPYIKEHFLFKDGELSKEYKRMLSFLTGYTMAGKNKNDDVPDGFAMFSDFIESLEGNKIVVAKRMF